jgi:diaminohydroxyphosphoribosylaminopyrimidine deaminase/5-amino-6-(5-phosphoribosylamino)uracil reductase
MAHKTETERLMALALRQALKGKGYTSPNPAVGCVVVKDGKVIAADHHREAGKPHAEILALKKAGDEAKDAELYVTLEPCCNYGRTPPCVDSIIDAGIKKVVIGAIDPNPKVNGKGIEQLKKAGIDITLGVLEKECRELNRAYSKYITTGLPFITIKYAQSLDGRIATRTGSSQWISSPEALKFAHKLRAWHDAVLIGAGTANHDNPQMTVRLVKGENPLRIILTASGKLKKNLRLLTQGEAPTIIATSRKGAANFRSGKYNNVEVLSLPVKAGGVDLQALLKALGRREITSLLVEGGAGVITGFLKQKLADNMILIVAPIIIGEGVNAVADLGIKTIDNSIKLFNISQKKIGSDCAVIGDLSGGDSK